MSQHRTSYSAAPTRTSISRTSSGAPLPPPPLPPPASSASTSMSSSPAYENELIDGLSDERETLYTTPSYTPDDLRIQASIIGAETTVDAQSKASYVSYRILVSTGNVVNRGLNWKVGRRFKDFENLHTELSKIYGQLVPKFPSSKTLTRNLDPEFIRKRKNELNKYLADLLLDPAIMHSNLLSGFLFNNISDLIICNCDQLREHDKRFSQIKHLESENIRLQNEMNNLTKQNNNFKSERMEFVDKITELQESNTLLHNELNTIQNAWENKFAELAVHIKEINKERKSALKFANDMDLMTRKLKQEKKILIKEIKEQRIKAAIASANALEGEGFTIENIEVITTERLSVASNEEQRTDESETNSRPDSASIPSAAFANNVMPSSSSSVPNGPESDDQAPALESRSSNIIEDFLNHPEQLPHLHQQFSQHNNLNHNNDANLETHDSEQGTS